MPCWGAIVFGLAALPAAGGPGMIAFGDHRDPEYGEETIEHNRATQATSAAFLALGLFGVVIVAFDIEIDARLTMVAVLVLAMADAPIRYLLLCRREIDGHRRPAKPSFLEKGRFDRSISLAFKLAEIFGCAIEEIYSQATSPALAGHQTLLAQQPG